jgi:hypothetical protein
VREYEMGGTCSMHGRDEKCRQYICLKTRSKLQLERSRHRWEDTVVNMVMNLWVPIKGGKFLD